MWDDTLSDIEPGQVCQMMPEIRPGGMFGIERISLGVRRMVLLMFVFSHWNSTSTTHKTNRQFVQ